MALLEVLEQNQLQVPVASLLWPTSLLGQRESGLGREEDDAVTAAVTDHANLDQHTKKPKNLRGKYTKYSDKQRATIGKYASQNGIERTRKHFLVQFLNLNESTVRYFKKSYLKLMKEQRNNDNSQPVTSIPMQLRGRPPMLLKLDAMLITFFQGTGKKEE